MVERRVVIIDGVRLASGSFGGTLKDMSAADLGVPVVKELFTMLNSSLVLIIFEDLLDC